MLAHVSIFQILVLIHSRQAKTGRLCARLCVACRIQDTRWPGSIDQTSFGRFVYFIFMDHLPEPEFPGRVFEEDRRLRSQS